MSRYKNVEERHFISTYFSGKYQIKEYTRTTPYNNFLPFISFQAYGDSTLWHLIAEVNEIINPFFVASDTVLKIPVEGTEERL